MLRKIHHLGVAVRSIAERAPFWTGGLGLPAPHLEEVASEKVRVAMLRVGESRIELLEPTSDDSVVARFLRERGEGIHHVGYRVENCAEALEAMVAAGATPLDKAPRPGSRGTTVAFIHPKGVFGTLIELVQE